MKQSEYHVISFGLDQTAMFSEAVNADLAAGYVLGGFQAREINGNIILIQTMYKEEEDDKIATE